MCRTFSVIVSILVAVGIGQAVGARATTVEVSIPFTTIGWHLMSLPLEPANNNILLDPDSGEIDPDSIFYDCYVAGNDPRNRLFRYEPGVGYWAYTGTAPPWGETWYQIDVAPGWWQGLWFLVDVPHTLTYTAYPISGDPMSRCLDISTSPKDWAWMMMGACARMPDPYDPDVTAWPTTSMVHDTMWGKSASCDELPALWWPTADCLGPDSWDSRCIGLPLSGYMTGAGYRTVSPSRPAYCGAPAAIDSLMPGEGYWLDVEDLGVWLRLQAGQWP